MRYFEVDIRKVFKRSSKPSEILMVRFCGHVDRLLSLDVAPLPPLAPPAADETPEQISTRKKDRQKKWMDELTQELVKRLETISGGKIVEVMQGKGALVITFDSISSSAAVHSQMERITCGTIEKNNNEIKPKQHSSSSSSSSSSAATTTTALNDDEKKCELGVVAWFMVYNENMGKEMMPSPCISSENNVPGLIRLLDFVSEEEEEELLKEIDQMPWVTGLSRRVQHYGYIFDYDKKHVSKDNCPPIPPFLTSLCSKITSDPEKTTVDRPSTPDQITINEYKVGDGISSHVDTHSAFGDYIISLSLGSDAVMLWTKAKDGEEESEKNISRNSNDIIGGGEREGGERGRGERGGGEEEEGADKKIRENVYLPRRSLAVMTGEARFAWEHAIVRRSCDLVDGQRQFRTRRVSITFRHIRNGECHCKYPHLCDSQQSKLPVGESGEEMEKERVHKFYDSIAHHFDKTRHSPWPQVEKFLASVKHGSLIADLGCGNGRYMKSAPKSFIVGTDICQPLVDLCYGKGFAVCRGDCLAVPFRSEAFDACLSIAVLHHLSTVERRMKAILEVVRVLKVGGRAIIYAWALEQGSESRIASPYERQDVLIPWRLQKQHQKASSKDEGQQKQQQQQPSSSSSSSAAAAAVAAAPEEPKEEKGGEVVLRRYCHLFREGELKGLCEQIEGVVVEHVSLESSNWCVIIRKDA